MFLLVPETDRGHPYGGVYPPVVVVVDLLVDGLYQLAGVGEPGGVAQLQLELRVERLLEPVLPRAGLPALGRRGPVRRQQGLVRARDVLAALVRVEPPRRPAGPPDGVQEGVGDQGGRVVVGHVPADDLPREDVHDRGDVPEAVPEPDVGEVPGPDHAGAQRAECGQDVRDECVRPPQVVRLHEPGAAPHPRPEPELAHHPAHGLLAQPQLQGHAPLAVRRVVGHDGLDLLFQSLVGGRFLGLVVERRAGDAQLPGEGGLGPLGLRHKLTRPADFFPPASAPASAGRLSP